MKTDICVRFRIPKYAFEVLKMLKQQNEKVIFELDPEDRTLTILSDMLDFPIYSDDWEKEDFVSSGFWEGVE